MAEVKIKINVEVTFKDGVSQRYQADVNTTPNDRFVRLFSEDREFLFNSDVIECIEIISIEDK